MFLRAHTDGDAIVKWEKANVLHMGDVYNASGVPFVDRTSGGTVAGMVAAMDIALGLADDNTRVVPGHGKISTKADMKMYRDAVDAVQKRVASEQKAGKMLYQAAEAHVENADGRTMWRTAWCARPITIWRRKNNRVTPAKAGTTGACSSGSGNRGVKPRGAGFERRDHPVDAFEQNADQGL